MKIFFTSAENYLERGKSNLILKKYSEAIEDLTKAIENFSEDELYCEKFFMAYYARGLAYKKIKNFFEATEDFKLALDYNRDSYESWYNLGICYQVLYGCEFAELAFDMAERLQNF